MEIGLYHHGIKGQRWGVRRYQNEDGTLTDVGKKRNESIKNNLNASKKLFESTSQTTKSSKQLYDQLGSFKTNKKTKDVSKMSDKELQEKVKRMNLERQYSDLSANQVARGHASVGTILDVAGSVLGVAGSAVGIALAIREFKK